MPITRKKTSGAGWAVFVILIFVCFVLCWVGLLIGEEERKCGACGSRVG